MRHASVELREVLQVQHGAMSRAQALHAGLSDSDLRTMVRRGAWERVAPSVYGVVGHRDEWVRRLWIAHLHAGPDSVVSHEAAARLRGFNQVRAAALSLIVPGSRHHGGSPVPEVRWHRAADVLPEDLGEIDGLPVTSCARTIVDVAGVVHIARLRSIVEQAVLEHEVTVPQLGSLLARTRRRGKRGVTALGAVINDMGCGAGLARSELEALLDAMIDRAGLPKPAHEHPLPGLGAVTGFVDRCWPGIGLIVEADGRRWHERRRQMSLDATRSLEARAAGYETCRLHWEHLHHDPDRTAQLFREVYLDRERLVGAGSVPDQRQR